MHHPCLCHSEGAGGLGDEEGRAAKKTTLSSASAVDHRKTLMNAHRHTLSHRPGTMRLKRPASRPFLAARFSMRQQTCRMFFYFVARHRFLSPRHRFLSSSSTAPSPTRRELSPPQLAALRASPRPEKRERSFFFVPLRSERNRKLLLSRRSRHLVCRSHRVFGGLRGEKPMRVHVWPRHAI